MYMIRRAKPSEAAAALAEAVQGCPCNRDAWAALGKLAQGNGGQLPGDVALPSHWMREVYLASVALDCQENQEALGRLQVRGASVATQYVDMTCF